ncbi:MAG: hypothetical protein JNL57_03610 [Bacteroidetes bacterium]|nr:hypothetical protein [Bacteroidota bacterium]
MKLHSLCFFVLTSSCFHLMLHSQNKATLSMTALKDVKTGKNWKSSGEELLTQSFADSTSKIPFGKWGDTVMFVKFVDDRLFYPDGQICNCRVNFYQGDSDSVIYRLVQSIPVQNKKNTSYSNLSQQNDLEWEGQFHCQPSPKKSLKISWPNDVIWLRFIEPIVLKQNNHPIPISMDSLIRMKINGKEQFTQVAIIKGDLQFLGLRVISLYSSSTQKFTFKIQGGMYRRVGGKYHLIKGLGRFEMELYKAKTDESYPYNTGNMSTSNSEGWYIEIPAIEMAMQNK